MKKGLKLSSNCIVVEGANRNLLLDLQHQKIYFIKKGVIALDNLGFVSIEGNKDLTNDLIAKDIVFELDKTNDSFTTLNMDYYFPSIIKKAILDYSIDSSYDIKKVLNELEELFCRFLELRFYNKIGLSCIKDILEHLEQSIIECVDLYIPFSSKSQIEELIKIKKAYPRLRTIFIHSCKEEIKTEQDYIIVSSREISNHTHCGNISYFYFSPNIDMVTESHNFNSCLNQKISVDVGGNIKNCPSMIESYGNIKYTSLKEALEKKGFKGLWNVKKDDIKGCKSCEFRYICTDCRAYLENPDDKYSKPLKCGYNPNTNEWEEWSQNPLKQKAIEYYEMEDIIKKDV